MRADYGVNLGFYSALLSSRRALAPGDLGGSAGPVQPRERGLLRAGPCVFAARDRLRDPVPQLVHRLPLPPRQIRRHRSGRAQEGTPGVGGCGGKSLIGGKVTSPDEIALRLKP